MYTCETASRSKAGLALAMPSCDGGSSQGNAVLKSYQLRSGVSGMPALDGIRVLDLSQVMAGPYCTMVLGDLGAEVIKVEKVQGGDDSRQMGPYVNGESTCFFQINRNKKGISLNLKSDEGREIFYELARTADIIVENYRPGVAKSLKVDFDTIYQINRGIVYCSISGYGQTGPYAQKGGFDLVAQGMSGIMSMTGEPGGRPLKSGIAVYDIGAGITAAYAILAAYISRQQTGEGQYVDVSLAECGLPWYAWEAAAYFSYGTIPAPTGSRHRVSAPYGALKTKNGYMVLGCANQRTWEKFCRQVVERPEWIDHSHYLTNTDRGAHVDELEAVIEEVLATRDSAYWIEKCEQAGVPAGPINDFEDVVKDPHYVAREMIQEVEHPKLGSMRMFGIPTKLSATPGTIRRPAPLLGQHTDEVLANIGISADRLTALREAGAVK